MLTLQKRLHVSFAIALALVLITGATSLYYLRQFDREVRETLIKDIELAASGESLREMLTNLESSFKMFTASPEDEAVHGVMAQGFEDFMSGVQQSQAISLLQDNITLHEEILGEGNDLRVDIQRSYEEPARLRKLVPAARRFFKDAREKLQTIQRQRKEEMASHRASIDRLFARAQQNQILIIVVVLVGGIFLAFFMPRRAVWPFRRIIQAFAEAWECNLSVRLPSQGADELGELSRSFNQMMAQLEELDEMKVKRIAFERRRFEVLANSLDQGVILVSVEGKVIFINAPAFRVFDVTSTQVINKDLEAVPLPPEIVAMLKEGLATKQRIENRTWEMTFKTSVGKEISRTVSIDMMPVRTHAGDLVNLLMFLEERDTPRGKRLFQREAHAAQADDSGGD